MKHQFLLAFESILIFQFLLIISECQNIYLSGQQKMFDILFLHFVCILEMLEPSCKIGGIQKSSNSRGRYQNLRQKKNCVTKTFSWHFSWGVNFTLFPNLRSQEKIRSSGGMMLGAQNWSKVLLSIFKISRLQLWLVIALFWILCGNELTTLRHFVSLELVD